MHDACHTLLMRGFELAPPQRQQRTDVSHVLQALEERDQM